jgi:hypothetical protein
MPEDVFAVDLERLVRTEDRSDGLRYWARLLVRKRNDELLLECDPPGVGIVHVDRGPVVANGGHLPIRFAADELHGILEAGVHGRPSSLV